MTDLSTAQTNIQRAVTDIKIWRRNWNIQVNPSKNADKDIYLKKICRSITHYCKNQMVPWMAKGDAVKYLV